MWWIIAVVVGLGFACAVDARRIKIEARLLTLLTDGEQCGRQLAKRLILFGKPMPYGILYAALERLEKQGLVSSSVNKSEPEDPNRGGYPRRLFKLTKRSKVALWA